ncbi:hypothetical protein TNCV_1095851, partial [Trichonephila clavipes]
GRWNLNIQHLPKPHRITELSTHRGQITGFWMCCLTRSPNFLLIVEKCQTFGCVASPDHRIFFVEKCQTFGCVASPDHRNFFSMYPYINIQHLPEPHRITEFSSRRAEM